MNKRNTLAVAGLALLFAGLVHLVRVVLGWEIVIDGTVIPLWVSYIIIIVGGYVGFSALGQSRRTF